MRQLQRLDRPWSRPLKILDGIGLSIAWFLAFFLRFHTPVFDGLLGPAQSPTPNLIYLIAFLPIVVLQISLLVLFGAYRRHPRLVATNLRRRTQATLVAWTILFAVSAFIREPSYSRAVLAMAVGFSIIGVNITGQLVQLLLKFEPDSPSQSQVLILASGNTIAQRIEEELASLWPPRKVAGLVLVEALSESSPSSPQLPVLGDLSSLLQVCEQHQISEVYAALRVSELNFLAEAEQVLRSKAVDLHIVLDKEQTVFLNPSLTQSSNYLFLSIRQSPIQHWNSQAKRLFDVVFASVFLLISTPIFIVTALLIKLTSRGPIFFRQTRVSWGGQSFEMLKFRTMKVDAETSGPQFADRNDPRKTWIGSMLRRTSLDELPQLINVLRGDMSLVGPRPERPEWYPVIARQVPNFELRQHLKAGMTGWAQIHGLRGKTDFKERLAYDLRYAERWSLLFDLWILIRTVFGGFLSSNAY